MYCIVSATYVNKSFKLPVYVEQARRSISVAQIQGRNMQERIYQIYNCAIL